MNIHEKLKRYKVSKTGCWEWLGCLGSSDKRACVTYEKRTQYAARVVMKLKYGSIPEGMFALHHCDNPLCINPEHIYIGTREDNRADCLKRGRANLPFGENHHKAKLEEKDVLYIRNSEKSQRKLAKMFGVTQANICAIKTRKSWRHL